jgi:serine-type D-Ala-D-Ala carboxypeptidase (penicillin-binding protein 5/6)
VSKKIIVVIIAIISLSVSMAYILNTPHSNVAVPAEALAPAVEPTPIPAIDVDISAEAVVIFDPGQEVVLAANNPDLRLMPASTTKMMTAFVALQLFSPEEIITITRSQDAVGKSTKFTLGEQYTVIDILKAALINSGNDAALSLADHHPSGYQAFVDQMNLQALKWGLKNTNFTNVSGLEEPNHYSSAKDLAIIAQKMMQEPKMREMVNQKTATITSIDGKYSHTFDNTNQLLGQIPGIIGIKTGWTDNSGECLVTYVEGDRDLIVVVLNSSNRFADTKTLINWSSDL